MFDRWHVAKALFLPAFLLITGCQSLQTHLSDEPAEVIAKGQSANQSESIAGSASSQARDPDAPLDLWARIRQSYSLGNHDHERIDYELKRYAGKNGFFKRIAERADPYLFLIVEEMERNGIPGEVALLPIVESAFKPFAYSHGRASGLWQFISATGLRYGMKQSWWYDGRRDVLASTQGAAKYLNTLKDHFDGNWLLALASYNTGEYRVLREMKKNRQAGKPTDFWNLDLPRETEAYVPRLLAMAKIIADPAKYGIDLPPISNEPKLAVVETGGQLDLAIAADMAGISLDELYRLNPGFNRWATDPDGPHRLLV
ncbi:MAG: transglycosylase SLT domain-containing protein, partial [Gammaproteobacteria bacterium]